MEKLRLGVIGVGKRGTGLTKMFFNMDMVEVVAVCDLYEDRVEAIKEEAKKLGKTEPFGSVDYKDIVTRDKVDVVVVSTSWRSRMEIVLYAMRQGVAVGGEVGGANSVEDCFELVRVWEETKTPYMFCENCCYGERELAVLNIVKKGLFGDIIHCEGAYAHDLREEIATGREMRHYRLGEYLNYNRENYPSHELGPIMQVLDINRGNRFTSLVSMSSKAMGINEWSKTNKPEMVDTKFAQGDIVTTILKCENGQTVVLSLDTTLPRPYSRRFTVRGTKGMSSEDSQMIFFDGDPHTFTDDIFRNENKYFEEYAHPIWKAITPEEKEAGHGGMDYLCYSDFFNRVISGEPMPIDAYDGAVLMAVSPLTEMSIKCGGMPVAFPDFKGKKN